ncbi:MAG: zinc ribbon domain-containing protein [Thermodesulfobacteriota bacterium]|nr:zinc ribbon domain-containing protein [Thermodesulfobacteriota bacterium]
MLKCDKCGAGINNGAKFCSQCGDPVTEADKVTVPQADGKVADVEITFGKSTSANYAKAVAICENLPTYTVSGDGNQIQHAVTLPVTEIDLIVNLFDLVGSWKSSKMLINGQAATKKDLTYGGLGCFQGRQKAYDPAQYCYGESAWDCNIWGCKRLNMPISSFGGGWLDYGRFDQSGTWMFDKNRIRHELEAGLKENDWCPVLDKRRVLETFEKLPDGVNPKRDPRWDYQTRYQKVDGRYQDVAVGIRPVVEEMSFYVLGDYKPKWEPQEPIEVQRVTMTLDGQVIEDTAAGKTAGTRRPRTGNKKNKRKWYDSQIYVIVLLFLFFPVGLYGLWQSEKFSHRSKIIWSVALAVLLVIGLATEP